MEWCQTYRADPAQGLVRRQPCQTEPVTDRRTTTNAASIHANERLGSKANSVDGQHWSVEDLAQVVRERYRVEYQSRSSYIHLRRICGFSYQKTEKVFKSRSAMKIADFEEQVEKN
jgi:transposase